MMKIHVNSDLNKRLNYINYSKYDHDIITNSELPSAYSSYREKIMKYKKDSYSPSMNGQLYNRMRPFHSKDRTFILKNIYNVKNLSSLNHLKGLAKTALSHTNGFEKDGYGTKNNYVFFKRGKRNNRRFNESESRSMTHRRPHTQQKPPNEEGMGHRLEHLVNRSMDYDNFSSRESNAERVISARRKIRPNAVEPDPYATIVNTHKKRNKSVEIIRDPNKRVEDQNDLFEKLKQKVFLKYSSKEEQSKALNRIDLLK
jgi:hypothetical protein